MWLIKKIASKGDYLYAVVPDHPNRTANNYVLLHRVIMENHLGRLLTSDEVVHHKDENKKNNEISNLEVLSRSDHTKQHRDEYLRNIVDLQCPVCLKVFTRYKNQSFLQKPTKYKCTFCGPRCRGLFASAIQHKKPESFQYLENIDSCLVREYRGKL